jgi:hypothetical protein
VPGKYGTDDPEAVAALDEANAGLANDVDETASRVTANAESRRRIRECAGAGLQAAGESYGQDVGEAFTAGEAVPAPGRAFTDMGTEVAACLAAHFSNAPDVLRELGTYCAGRAADRAEDVLEAYPSAQVLAAWMTTTGAGLSSDRLSTTGTPVPSGSDRPLAVDDSSFPVWAFVLALLAVGAAVVSAVRRMRS